MGKAKLRREGRLPISINCDLDLVDSSEIYLEENRHVLVKEENARAEKKAAKKSASDEKEKARKLAREKKEEAFALKKRSKEGSLHRRKRRP